MTLHDTCTQEWTLKKLNEQRSAESASTTRQAGVESGLAHLDSRVERRQASQAEADATQLRMHWYNNQTGKWVHLAGGYISDGAFVADIPPVVLRNPAFSGQLSNMLVTEIPYDPKSCSEFETLVNGKCVTLSCSYYAFLEKWDTGCVEDSHCLIGTHACVGVFCVCMVILWTRQVQMFSWKIPLRALLPWRETADLLLLTPHFSHSAQHACMYSCSYDMPAHISAHNLALPSLKCENGVYMCASPLLHTCI
jgi:hypothetical protein